MKVAGGCGVVPFLSASSLFCWGMAAPASRGAFDRFGGLSWMFCLERCSQRVAARLTKGHKKARTLAG